VITIDLLLTRASRPRQRLMMPTNYLLGHEGTGTQPIPIESARHEDLEPVIGQLQSELQVLRRERAAILKRIGMIKKTIVSLADLFGSDVINGELQNLLSLQSARRLRTHTGLTDLCRQLLRESSEPLTVRQIMGQLQERSPVGLAGHRHPLNSLRMIFKRLVAYGEAEELMTEKGLRAWRATSFPAEKDQS
jgi:hypothetical protein